MAAKTAARDSRLHEKSKQRRQDESDEEEEEEEELGEEEEDESPSNSEVETSAAQRKKTADMRKELQQEEKTQKQLEERIADLKRKNAKSNQKFAELQNSQFADEDAEDVPRARKTNKRRKRSIKDDRAWDAPSVMFSRLVW